VSEEHPPNWVVWELLWLVITTAFVAREVDSQLLTTVVIALFVLCAPLRYVARFVNWRPQGRLADVGHRLAAGRFTTALGIVTMASFVLALAWTEEFWLAVGLGFFTTSLLQLTLTPEELAS